MKKFAKTTGIILLSLVGLAIVVFLLARFAFRDQSINSLNSQLQEQRTELLRTSGSYVADPDADFHFTYTQDSVQARKVYNYFRLDTLLHAQASTWDNAIALASFIARNIPHANQTIQPKKRNATALWEYHLNVERAFNCRLHSIMLHEILLASGITNRFVTCLPADPKDFDCHVVNIIWLPERQKWAMIDSDMQAYLTDPAGTPLSLEEMRQRYIADEPMSIHGLLSKRDDDNGYYRAYWAKNLYWFACWEQTGYDKESAPEGRYIYLLPQGFKGFDLKDRHLTTTDAARFWAAPDTDTTI